MPYWSLSCSLHVPDRFGPVHKKYFPPPLNLLLSWTTLFRSGQTLRNYLGYVQTGCLLAGVPTTVGLIMLTIYAYVVLQWSCVQVFQDPALKRAKSSVDSAGYFSRRERMFIRRHMVEEMVRWSESNEHLRKQALMFLLSYSFLLRTPSEAMPAIKGVSGAETGSNSILFKNDDQLVLVLHRRKNKPSGSRLVRKCTCQQSPDSCVYHLIGALLDGTPIGGTMFGEMSVGAANLSLRLMLNEIGTENACMYRTHDLRRGHAEDLRLAGAPLWKILAAGEWRSPAFMEYLDVHRMETDLVMQGCLDEESDSDQE